MNKRSIRKPLFLAFAALLASSLIGCGGAPPASEPAKRPDETARANTNVPSENQNRNAGNGSVETNANGNDTPESFKADLGTVETIDAYCKAVDRFVGDSDPDLIVADVADYDDRKKGKWRRFASEEELESFREKSPTYTVAYNWTKEGRILKSNLSLFYSPSGDNAKDIYHCFRADGSLAYVLTFFGSFNDGYKFEERRYFDRNGGLIKRTEKYFDLDNEPIKKPDASDTAGMRDRADYYLAAGKLPFAGLVAKKAK